MIETASSSPDLPPKNSIMILKIPRAPAPAFEKPGYKTLEQMLTKDLFETLALLHCQIDAFTSGAKNVKMADTVPIFRYATVPRSAYTPLHEISLSGSAFEQ